MYFDFKEVSDFKEIMYQIPFDELLISGDYQVKGYQYDSGSIVENLIKLELSHSDYLDFKPALNFYRLLLNQPNQKYTLINLEDASIQSLTSSTVSNYRYLENSFIFSFFQNYISVQLHII